MLDKIRMKNQKLESAINLCGYTHNGNNCAATNYFATQISLILTVHQLIQQIVLTVTNKMCHLLRRTSSERTSYDMELTSRIRQGYYRVRNGAKPGRILVF